MKRFTVNDVRIEFSHLLDMKLFTHVNREASMTSIVGSKTIEIIGASFVADEETIFGDVNPEYQRREHDWYMSMSRSVNDFPGGAPEVWKAIASKSDGTVNSNYGWAVYSPENGQQFARVVAELRKNPESRRAEIIYTRPTMWDEYNVDGRSDFMCTEAVQYVIRNGKIDAIVKMRSNDAHIGFKNDRQWQQTCLDAVAKQLAYPTGRLFWQVGSLHFYERDFYLVDHYAKTGDTSVKKSRYRELYPDSPYLIDKVAT